MITFSKQVKALTKQFSSFFCQTLPLQVDLVAVTDHSLASLKFILGNRATLKPRRRFEHSNFLSSRIDTLITSQCDFDCFIRRLYTDMCDRKLDDLKPVLYSAGFPCQPYLDFFLRVIDLA